MNSLDRAKRFLASKTAKLALVAIPLAMAVPAAFAQATETNGITGPISFSTGSCFLSNGSGTCGTEQLSSIGGNPLANWVDIFSNGAIFPNFQTGSLSFAYSGGATGTVFALESFPVSWDFSLNNIVGQLPANNQFSQPAPMDVSLEWFLNGTNFLTEDLGTLGAGTYTGSASFTPVPSAGNSFTLSSYEILVSITNDTSLSVNSPSGTSIDLNSSAATPEPASFLLAGAGLLGLLHRFRRRKV